MSDFQQVNLYRDELRTRKLKYSALMLVQLSIFIIVVFFAVSTFKFFQLQQQQKRYAANQEKQKTVMRELSKLQIELSKQVKDRTLIKKINQKTTELANKQKVLGILSQDEFGNTSGFVEHISGLARQRIDGLWLTKIRIAAGGTDVALRGTTSKPALLPKYLQRLSAEKIFVGTEFKSLFMSRQEKKKQWLDFSLKNKKTDEVNP